MVNHESGLLGISETSPDMRDLLASEATDVRAAEAVALFCYQTKKWIGSFAAALGGIETLIFSAGIGENDPQVRERICAGLNFLGIELDAARNASNAAVISTAESRVTVRVIRTDEELMIARSVTVRLLGAGWSQPGDLIDEIETTRPGIAAQDGRLLARGELSLRRTNLFIRQSAVAEAAETGAHQAAQLLGHWGTTPGLNFIYVHMNRIIKEHDLNAIYIAGPGHGGPGLVANTYLEGTYSEVYPNIAPDEAGMKKLFKQFSFPGGIPSHVAPETPGSIHEGGELGYSLSHAFGAVFDNPDLLAVCVVGDGEAETGALATSWHSNKFLNPALDGAVLPILHLNGWKIAGPTVLARIPQEELESLLRGYGYKPHWVEGDEPETRCIN